MSKLRKETERSLAEAKELISKLNPPDNSLLQMLRIAEECYAELRRTSAVVLAAPRRRSAPPARRPTAH